MWVIAVSMDSGSPCRYVTWRCGLLQLGGTDWDTLGHHNGWFGPTQKAASDMVSMCLTSMTPPEGPPLTPGVTGVWLDSVLGSSVLWICDDAPNVWWHYEISGILHNLSDKLQCVPRKPKGFLKYGTCESAHEAQELFIWIWLWHK